MMKANSGRGGVGAVGRVGARWKLEDAKARLSEVVRLACDEGPQVVSVRGKDRVVVVSVEALARLLPPEPVVPLVAFLEGLALAGVGVEREADFGRDLEL